MIAQVDPFSPLCQGGKIPDANTVQSIGFPMTELTSLNLPAADTQRICAFLPSVNRSIITGNMVAGAGWTWPTTYTQATSWSKASAVGQTIELSRPVAHGIRISCPYAPTSITGFVHVAIAYESFRNEGTWPWATSLAQLSGYQQYKRVTLASLTQSSLTIVNKYTDETAFRYTSASLADEPASGATSGSNPFEFSLPYSWGTILVYIEGGPVGAQNLLQVESILHLEGIPKNDSFLMGGLAAAYSPQILGATSNMVSKTDMGYMDNDRSSFIASAYNEAAAGASSALSEIGGQVASAARGAAYRGVVTLTNLGLRYLAGQARRAFGGGGLPGVNAEPNRLMLTR